MENLRLIKKAELFYKQALWSLFKTKVAAESFVMSDDEDEGDDYDDLGYDELVERLESDLENPNTFSAAFTVVMDQFSLMPKSDQRVKSFLNDLEKINGDFRYAIASGKFGSIKKDKVEEAAELNEYLNKYLSNKGGTGWEDQGNFPPHIYLLAAQGLVDSITNEVSSLFSGEMDAPTNLEELADSIEEIVGGAASEYGGEAAFDPTNPQAAKTRAEKLAKMKEYQAAHRANLRMAKEKGDPDNWDPAILEKLEPFRVAQIRRHWASLQKRNARIAAEKAKFKQRMAEDPAFASKVRSQGRERAKKHSEKHSVHALSELEANYDALFNKILAAEEKLQNAEKSGNTSEAKRLQEEISKINKEMAPIKDRIEKIKTVQRGKAEHRTEETIDLSESVGRVYEHPSIPGKWLTMSEVKALGINPKTLRYETRTSDIRWSTDGWGTYLLQDINTVRSEIKKKIIANIKGDPDLMKEFHKKVEGILQAASNVEAPPGRPKPRPASEARTAAIQTAISTLTAQLSTELATYPAAMEFGMQYAQNLDLVDDYRMLAKYDLAITKTMDLDDPDKKPGEQDISLLSTFLERGEAFLEKARNIDNPFHAEQLRSTVKRLYQFMDRVQSTIDTLRSNSE